MSEISEIDKKGAEMPQRWKLEKGPDGAWDTATMTTTGNGEWCKVEDVSAALARRYREGYEKGYQDAKDKKNNSN